MPFLARKAKTTKHESKLTGSITKPTKKGAAKIIQHTVISNTNGFGNN
jgi:hypothetical protein